MEKDVPFTMNGDKLTVTTLGANVDFEVNSMDIAFTVISTDQHGHSASRGFSIPITGTSHLKMVSLPASTYKHSSALSYLYLSPCHRTK